MKKEDIHLWDFKRILFGQAPPEFLLEVLIRSLIMYLFVIVITRLLGKRMNGQLTILEMSVMVMMGAILAVPMQVPDRGILQGVLLLISVLLLLRGVNLLGFKYSRFEKLLQGEGKMLVKDGVLHLPALNQTKISRQQLYAILRSRNILHLGKVKRCYIEACGLFSLYQEKTPKPGLSLLPKTDEEMFQQLHMTDQLACTNCGWIQDKQNVKTLCPNCGSENWTAAVS